MSLDCGGNPRKHGENMQTPHRKASWLSRDSNQGPSCCEATVLQYSLCNIQTLTRRFSGLMSRWTMLRLCRYLIALARLYSIPLASRSVYLLEEVMASKRSPPCSCTHNFTEYSGTISEQSSLMQYKKHYWKVVSFLLCFYSIYSMRFVRFVNVFKRSLLCSPRLHLLDQKYSKDSKIMKYYYNSK